MLSTFSYVYADKFTARVQNDRIPNACMHRNVSCVHVRYVHGVRRSFKTRLHRVVFSQPSIYIDGWLYGMGMTSVVCNVRVLSQNDSTYHHSVFTT